MALHLITLCIGFIIAYGLLQLIELFRRRRRQRAADAAALAAKSSGHPPDTEPPAPAAKL
jgi:hypothetical protein